MSNWTKEKELSLLCCIIRDNELINGTLFQTFDRIYEIAEKFIEKYGVDDTEWGIEMEYEETVIAFAKMYISTFDVQRSI